MYLRRIASDPDERYAFENVLQRARHLEPLLIPLANLHTQVMLRLMVMRLLVQALLVQAGLGQPSSLAQDASSSSSSSSPQPISTSLFVELERTARLTDTTYCLGTTGIYKPFTCLSWCGDFPGVQLEATWNTGILLADNAGFLAVDLADPDTNAGGAIVVAFRGTYSIGDTVIDLATVPQKLEAYPSPDDGAGTPSLRCENCTVHAGFLLSWQTARHTLMPRLIALKQQYPEFPVRIIGHSLGGAVACLAALELAASLGWIDVEVTTYGQPRVGNDNFAQFVDDVFGLNGTVDAGSDTEMKYRRVTHQHDPVPLLPPNAFGFRSSGGEIYIGKASLPPSVEDVVHCDGDEDLACSAGTGVVDLLGHSGYFVRLGLCTPKGFFPFN